MFTRIKSESTIITKIEPASLLKLKLKQLSLLNSYSCTNSKSKWYYYSNNIMYVCIYTCKCVSTCFNYVVVIFNILIQL